MGPTQGEVHIDVGLSDASIYFRNEEFIAEDFLRTKMVDKMSDKIWTYGREAFKLVNDLRAPGTRGVETTWSLSTISYQSDEHSQTGIVPDQARSNQDPPLSLEVDTTEIETAKIQLRLEFDTAAMLSNTANYAAGLSEDLSGAGNLQWSDPNSDPIGDIEAAKALVLEACGQEPNCAAMGHKVKLALKNHPKIIARFSYNGRGAGEPVKVTDQMLADLFDLDEIMDAKGQYDTSPDAVTGSFKFIWGNNFILSVRPASIGVKTLAHSCIVRVRGYRLTESWYQQPESSTYIRVRDHYVPFLISNVAGFLFYNCVAAGA
jgi:hypothetical protein